MRFPTPLTPIIISKLIGSSDVTAAAVASAIHSMTGIQKAGVRTDIGAEPQKLTVTVTQSGATYSANKTFEEMWTAYNTDKKTVTVAFSDDEYVLSSADPSSMAFASLSVGSGNGTLKMLTVDENDDWVYTEFTAGMYTETVSGTTPTVTPAANTRYKCGPLTSLTISNPPATGAYSIEFTSGSTPTVVTLPPPPAMRWQTANNAPPQGFPEANTRYEISVEDTYVLMSAWPVVPEVEE